MRYSMIALAALTLLAVASGTSAFAATLTDQEVQVGYDRAYHARLQNRPDITESILERLVDERPNAARIRFDLGVAQAEQGNCAQAARSFARGEDLAQTPSFARASQDAMADLCPKIAPFEASLNVALRYDSNINSGASTDQIEIGGFPVTLTDDAIAQPGFGYVASGGLAYNHQISQTFYLVPSVSFSLNDMQGSDHDNLAVSTGLSLRYRGDKVDVRFGPTLYHAFDTDGVAERGWGVAGRMSYTINPTSGLYFNAAFLNVTDQENTLADYTSTIVGVRYVKALKTRNMVVRAGLSWSDKDYEDDLQDLKALTADVGLSGSLTDQVGFDISLSHTLADGAIQHPFFGVVRSDAITTVSASASFAKLESPLGRPYVGISHTISSSSFASKDYDRTSFNIGFTRSF